MELAMNVLCSWIRRTHIAWLRVKHDFTILTFCKKSWTISILQVSIRFDFGRNQHEVDWLNGSKVIMPAVSKLMFPENTFIFLETICYCIIWVMLLDNFLPITHEVFLISCYAIRLSIPLYQSQLLFDRTGSWRIWCITILQDNIYALSSVPEPVFRSRKMPGQAKTAPNRYVYEWTATAEYSNILQRKFAHL